LDEEIGDHLLVEDVYNDDAYKEHLEKSEEYDDKLSRVLTALNTELEDIIANKNNNKEYAHVNETPVGPRPNHAPRLKLPQVELPKFDGEPESFDRFITSFESIVDKFELSPFEKYTYLLATTGFRK
jgi:hypothetical protein